MTGTRTELVGGARLALTLRAAAAELAHLNAATESTSRLVQSRARGAAPKRSGRLSSSVRAESTGDTARVSVGVVYAGVQEYGWSAHGIRAHPYLNPAAHATEPVWRRYYVENVNKVLDRVKGK